MSTDDRAERDFFSSLFSDTPTKKPAQADDDSSFFSKLFSSEEKKPAPYQPTERNASKRPSAFTFERGKTAENIKKLLHRAESPDYITLAGGNKAPEIQRMTVADVGRKFGNKAAGKYQIQRNTANDVLKAAGIDPETFIFNEKGQDKLFGLLLEQRGKLGDYRKGKITKQQVAKNLSTVWAGFPKDSSGKSFYEGVSGNKAHVGWQDVLAALD